MGSPRYQPQPLNTESVSLPPDLRDLTERLAENTHDLWAAERIRQGWSWGPKRDDSLKQHPCLIPYAELPETEKDFDRQTSIGTLKAIIALGYRVVRE